MRDRLPVFSGLAVFLGVVTLPFWYNALAKAGGLRLKRPATATQCVEDTAFMRRSHMKMLNSWRDRRVRDGARLYRVTLTATCLDECHGNRAGFCDRCHTYVGLNGPYCWDCHEGNVAEVRP
jgi:hypothetical protein